MWIVSLAAVAIGLLAPVSRSAAWGVPLTMFSWAMVLRAIIGAALTTLVAGALCMLAFEPHIAAAIGAGIGGLLAFSAARRSRYLRGTALLCYRLTQPDNQEEAMRVLDARLKVMTDRLTPAGYAQVALFASVPLTGIGEWRAAADHVERIEIDALVSPLRERVLQALATLRLEHGDLEGAQDALAQIKRPADAEVERWLNATEALLFAIQGNVEEALSRADAFDDPEDAAIAASYGVVRAHAFASQGKDEDAKKALLDVRALAGDEALIRAVRPLGPATELAREMMQ